MDDKKEYQIVDGSASDCQKTLNQWRHIYDLEILNMCSGRDGYDVAILLIRTRKESK